MKAEFDIEVNLKRRGKINLKKELEIKTENLSEELENHAPWYAYYATLLAETVMDYEEMKAEFDSLYSEVASEHRATGGGTRAKITEKQVELDTTMDSRIRGAQKRLLVKKREVELMKVIVRSFESRLQCLIALGHWEGKQRFTDPSVRFSDLSVDAERVAKSVKSIARKRNGTDEDWMRDKVTSPEDWMREIEAGLEREKNREA